MRRFPGEERNDTADALIATYLNRRDRGEEIEWQAFAAAHPEFEEELKEFFETESELSSHLDAEEQLGSGESLTGGWLCPTPSRSGNERSDTLRRNQALISADYTLLEELGCGGMGIVYRAHQSSLRRTVAIKMLHLPQLATAAEVKRFQSEAAAAAQLNHPNIVSIFEVQSEGPTPYFSMEYLSGPSLRDLIQAGPLRAREAAAYVRTVACAVHHAHQRGVLHRDLKPSNVLLDELGHPHVTDFGLAKFGGNQDLTLTTAGQILGTPGYMAPEQAVGSEDITVACDVYGLGAILYALLTARPPFEADSPMTTVLKVRSEDPVSPRLLNRQVPDELVTICMKCLQKVPAARYCSAAEVAEDLERWINGIPIRARPISTTTKALKWMRRNPAWTAAGSVTSIFILVVLCGLLAHGRRLKTLNAKLEDFVVQLNDALRASEELKRVAERSSDESANLRYVSDMKLASRAVELGDLRQLNELLGEYEPAGSRDVDRRGLEWYWLDRHRRRPADTWWQSAEALYFVDFDAEGRRLAACGADATVRIFASDSGRLLHELPTGQGEVNGLAFSADGDWLATAGDDGTVRVWSLAARQEVLQIPAYDKMAFQVVFSPDDEQLITCGTANEVHVWERKSGKLIRTLPGHSRTVDAVALCPQRGMLFTAGADHVLGRWNLATGQPIHLDRFHRSRVTAVAASADERLVASGSLDCCVRLHDLQTDAVTEITITDSVQSVAVAPDASLVAVGDRAGTIHLYPVDLSHGDRVTTSEPVAWVGHESRVYGLGFSRDGSMLVSAGKDGDLHCWQVDTLNPLNDPNLQQSLSVPDSRSVQFQADSTHLLTLSRKEGVRRWQLRSGEWQLVDHWALERQVAMALSPDESVIAFSRDNRECSVELRDVATGKLRWERPSGFATPVTDVAFSADGQRLILTSFDSPGSIRIRRVETGESESMLSIPGHADFAVDPDGRHLFVEQEPQQRVLRWDLQSNQQVEEYPPHGGTIKSLRVSRDGRYVVSVADDRSLLIIDRELEQHRMVPASNRGQLLDVICDSTGRSALTLNRDGTVKILQLATGQEMLTLLDGDGLITRRLEMSADGRWLACTHEDAVSIVELSLQPALSADEVR